MAYVPPTHWVKHLGAAKTGRLLSVPISNAGPHPFVHRDAITADAAQNDTIGLFEVKTSHKLSAVISFVAFTALGASVVGDVGFADDADLGISAKGAVLASDINMAAAGSGKLIQALGAADWDKAVWEILGLAKDPQGVALVVLTLQGANPASGSIFFEQGVLPN